MNKSISIDEEGYFVLQNGIRLNDDPTGKEMLESLEVNEYGVTSMEYKNETIIVEPFDKPLVASQVYNNNNLWEIALPYQCRFSIDIESLSLDSWDRFHGLTTTGIPFVLSRKAQAEFFNLLEEFTDDSITLNGKVIETKDYYQNSDKVNKEDFWSQKYKEHPSPPWNLNEPHPELKSILPQLKLTKRRILVLGCGLGHDAAYIAEQGHIVTAIDISPTAIETAQKTYSHINNLRFEVGDIFNLDEKYYKQFDIVFEHTLYCAISPDQRKNLIKVWRRCLEDTGHLLGIFFVNPKRTGPPFGGSEWELKNLLENSFHFLYWTRLQFSPGWRNGAELIIYAQIKNNS